MIFPDYKRSVVNVACSVIDAFGGKPLYPPLKELEFIKDYEKTVLLTLDGLGYEFLKNYGKGSFLEKNCVARITSTFPATTAAAATALETGVGPQQHAVTGWNMYIKELGLVARPVLFEPRFGKLNLAQEGVDYKSIFTENRVGKKIKFPSTIILRQDLMDDYKPKDERVTGFCDLPDMIGKIKKTAAIPGKRFIYAYWLEIDKLSHKYGCRSKEVLDHFQELDKELENLAVYLKEKDTCLVITADHGLLDVKLKNQIALNRDYPEIYDCLILPICGDTRAAFCYVRPEKAGLFRKLVKEKLSDYCVLRKGSDFIKKGVFGLGTPNPRLYERVGDYILVCKESYLIRDLLMNEEKPEKIGYHGGMSKEEMYVPLIVVR